MHASAPQTISSRAGAKPPWYQEPIVHFIGIGVLIFTAYAWFGGGNVTSSLGSVSHDIHVTRDQIVEINRNLGQNLGHAPSSGELTDAIDQWVKDEILHRQGIAMGLDQNDPVIRNRVVQLMKWYLVGGLGTGAEPSEAELRERYEATEEKNRGANIVCFEQIFFSTARRGKTAETDATITASSFQAGTQTGPEVAIGHGDSMGGEVVAEEMQRGRAEDLKAKFGLPFVASVQRLPFNRWSGPLESLRGWHVVRHLKPQNQTFEELRPQIRSELLTERGAGSPDESFAAMKKAYNIQIDELPKEVQK